MTTQILNLPLLSLQILVGNNEDWVDSWSYVDGSGNPLSLAGLTLALQVRPLPSSPTVVLSAVPLTGGTANNVLAVYVPVATMKLVAPGSYLFEVQAQGDGFTRTIALGVLSVTPGVLR